MKLLLKAFVLQFVVAIANSSPLSDSVAAIENSSIKSFKVQLQHTLEGARIRKKRQAGLLTTVSDSQRFKTDYLRVSSSYPGTPSYLSQFNITAWTDVRYYERYQLCAGTQSGELILLDLSHNKTANVVSFAAGEHVAQKIKAFVFHTEEWFVVLQSASEHTWIQLYQRVDEELKRRQSIVLDGESDFDLISVRGIHYLITVTYQKKMDSYITYEVNAKLYHWTRTQFDLIASREAHAARSISAWTMNGALYFAVSQEMRSSAEMVSGSPIFFYNAVASDKLVLLDELQVRDSARVRHFSVSGSHYLIFVGASNAKIYWWSNSQFLPWQTIDNTAGAVDVSVLALFNGEVVLVVALKEEVLFLTLDATGHYFVTFSMKLSGFDLKSIQFMFDGKDFYALALSAANMYSYSIWKLGLDHYDLPDATALDTLIQCLSSLKDATNVLKNEVDVMRQDIDRVWVRDKDQVISAVVLVQGSVSAALNPSSIVDEVVITSNQTEFAPNDIGTTVTVLAEEKVILEAQLSDLLLKTGIQEVPGPMYFADSISVPSLNIPVVDVDITINGISVLEMASKALKKFGDQHFVRHVQLDHLSVANAFVYRMNDISIQDLVLLQGQQNISGHWEFVHVSGSNMVTGAINYIPLSDVITTHTDQNITELKSFSALSSYAIDVLHKTNGEFLKDIYNQMITIDTNQTISGRFELMAPTMVLGSVISGETMNTEISLQRLDSESVKKDSHQDIFGTKVFVSDVHATRNANVRGLVNNINLNQVVTTSTDQTITGNVEFIMPVTFANVLSTFVNDLDLNQDVIFSNNDQAIEGHKVFQHGLVVTDVSTNEGVKIDGVNVLEEAKTVVNHIDGVVTSIGSFYNVEVLGDLRVLSGMNGFMIYDLPTSVWLKSHPQQIDVPVVFPSVAVFNSLQSTSVNNLNLQSDVVSVLGSHTIVGEKTFINNTHLARGVEVASGQHLSGFDFYAFQEQLIMDKLDTSGTVHGTKIISGLEVLGSIIADGVNGINFATDVLLPTAAQAVSGEKELRFAVINDNIAVGRVQVNLFNGVPFLDFVQSTVLKDQVSLMPVTSKSFSHLIAQGISISGMGQIDGVVILDMILRSVTLDDYQSIAGNKTFLDPVYLSMPSIAVTVNGLDSADHLSRVVFTDESTVITGRKRFVGPTTAASVQLVSLNAVNVSALAESYISRTEYDDIAFPWYINNGISVGSLNVTSSITLDGVVLDEAVKVHEHEVFSQSVQFFTDVKVNEHLEISELVNGCDISNMKDILQQYHDSSQVFRQPVKLDRLKVAGNINIVGTLNEVPLSNLVISNGIYQDVGELHIYPGITASNIKVTGNLNQSDISYFLNDAVLKSSEQVITGYKHYGSDLEVAYLTGGGETLLSETLNSIMLDDILKSAVMQTGFQVIEGDKIFRSLRANNATMFEFINGIKLPYDIVLTDEPEHISAPVFFMKDMQIHSSLTVQGLLDGVLLDQLIGSSVSLTGNESIMSSITFSEDVHISGRLDVSRMLNNLYLALVATVSNPGKIEGSKSFTQSMNIYGNLTVPFINAVDVEELARSVVYHSANETLTSQVFMQKIHVEESLLVGFINGIDMNAIQSGFHDHSTNLNSTLGFFKDLGNAQSQAITHQISAISNQISQFAYFVLHQEVNLEAHGILQGFPRLFPGSYSAVAHMTQKQCVLPNECCSVDYSYWMTFDKMAMVVFTSAPHPGRLFPVVPLSTASLVHNQGLVVWTNTTLSIPKCCNMEGQKTIIGAISSSGLFQPYLVVMSSSWLLDVKSFKDAYTYIVAAYHFDSKNGVYGATVVYQGHESTNVWREHQELPFYGALSMDLTIDSATGEVLLALGSGMGSYPDSYSSVYHWNSTYKMFEPVFHIPSQNVKSILWIKKENSMLLAVGNVDNWIYGDLYCSAGLEGGHVDIYAYNHGFPSHIQTLHLPGVVSMISFTIIGETYLAIASLQLQTIVIYEWQGYSGFRAIQSIAARNVQHLNQFWEEDQLYVSIASSSGSSMLWKAIARGAPHRIAYANSQDTVTSELRDQPVDKENTSSC